MLQTRLYPYFQGEGRRITFAAAPAYLLLVKGCFVFGILGALIGFIAPMFGVSLPPYAFWWVLTGSMVTSAGIIAAVSLPSMTFDLRERVYRRWDGIASVGRHTRGRLDMLDAIVVTAHHNIGASLIAGGFAVEYRMTLHWKGAAQPPLLCAGPSVSPE